MVTENTNRVKIEPSGEKNKANLNLNSRKISGKLDS